MSFSISYDLICSDCGKQFRNKRNLSFFEEKEELIEEAELLNWKCLIKVPNGSLWDFCPECYDYYKTKE